MQQHGVCPWWIGRVLASPLRRLWSDPATILADRVEHGMTVLEPGPGMGFFTLVLAERVGPHGRVIAVDRQPKMIEGLEWRARKAGVMDRVVARVCDARSMGLDDFAGRVDFTFAFAVVHEMPDARAFFREAATASKACGRLMLVEPAGHVDDALFDAELVAAREAGFMLAERPLIKGCRAAVFERQTDA